MTTKKHLVGHIGIDAGMCIVGDPCYLRTFNDDSPSVVLPLDGTWGEFLERLPKPFREIGGASSIGHAVISSTGHGDGLYPVYVETDAKNPAFIKRLIIDFEI
jgi:hypothetical protein